MHLIRDLAWQKYDLTCQSSVAYQFARYALGLNYELLPQEVVHEAKRALLDTLGVAIGSYKAPARPMFEAAVNEFGGHEEATLIGSGQRTGALNAALFNSFLVRWQDFNDVGTGSHVRGGHGNHSSDSIASILATCEKEKADGRDLLTSLVISYELGFRAGTGGPALPGEPEPPRPQSRAGLLDSRASLCMPPALGKVMKMNEDQIANAIGICASHSFALGVIMREGATHVKDIRFGWIAHDALLSCIMAKYGFAGPIRVYESEAGLTGLGQAIGTGLQLDPDRIVDFSGWRIMDTRYKYYRGCAGLHGQIEATLSVVIENDLKPEDIAAIRIICSTMAMFKDRLPYKYPRFSEAADHSPYFTNAIAIKERALNSDSYEAEKFTDPVVLDLIDKIELVFDPKMPAEGGACEITTKNGRRFEKRVDNPHGFYEDPLNDKELEDKFTKMAIKYMNKKEIKKIFDTVWNIEKLDDVNKLMSQMVWK